MHHSPHPPAFGLAAFEVMSAIAEQLIRKDLLSTPDFLGSLEHLVQTLSERGLANNNDNQTDAAQLVAELALKIRRRL